MGYSLFITILISHASWKCFIRRPVSINLHNFTKSSAVHGNVYMVLYPMWSGSLFLKGCLKLILNSEQPVCVQCQTKTVGYNKWCLPALNVRIYKPKVQLHVQEIGLCVIHPCSPYKLALIFWFCLFLYVFIHMTKQLTLSLLIYKYLRMYIKICIRYGLNVCIYEVYLL